MDKLTITRIPNKDCQWVSVITPEPRFATQWKIVDFVYAPGDGNTCSIKCVDEQGQPLGDEYFYQIYPSIEAPDSAGGSPIVLKTLADGTTNFPISAIQRGNEPGPYCGMIRMGAKDSVAQYEDGWSEIFVGVGNHENRHDRYSFTFQRTSTSPTVPHLTLEETVKQVASTYVWMPVNNGGALWKFAKAQNLQDQQTDEFTFLWNGDSYTAQVFNLGIVYAKTGDWSNIKILTK